MPSPSPLPPPPPLPPLPPPPPSSNSSLLIIATLLAFVFVLTAIIHLVLRFLARSFPSPTSSTSFASSTSSTTQLNPNHKSLPDSLPLFTLSSLPRCPSVNCTICLSKFTVQDKLRVLPTCLHTFHSPCIDTWIQSTPSCPLCRSSVQVQETEPIAEPLQNQHHQEADGHEVEVPAEEESVRASTWLKEYVDRLTSSASSSFNSMRFSSWGSQRYDGEMNEGSSLEMGESFGSDSGYFASSYKWIMAGATSS